MTRTMLPNGAKRRSSLAKLHLLALATLAAILSVASVPKASAQAVTLLNRTITNTDFQTQNTAVSAGCSVANCTAVPQPIFPVLRAVCPALAGKTCTYYIHLESQDHFLSPLDAGLFQFLVDGAPPNPGPTFGPGFFTWNNNDPTSPTAVPQSHSYAVTARVKNKVDNQPHAIRVSVSCIDTNASGACTAATLLSNLEVNIYTP
jgi:hypothetical protein